MILAPSFSRREPEGNLKYKQTVKVHFRFL